jgi:hypothetical protein
MSWGARGKKLYINDLDFLRLKNTIINRKSAFNIVEWMFLKKVLRLKDKDV